jgi:hypothetical protein
MRKTMAKETTNTSIDPKEMADRVKAAKALADENEKHFVDYAKEMKRDSEESNKDIRDTWETTWQAYMDVQDPNTVIEKEDWQSDISLSKPFTTIQQAKAVIRKSLLASGTDFYHLMKRRKYQKSNKQVDTLLGLMKIVMDAFHDENHADFATAFIDATEVSFTTGQSMEMIPVWENGTFRWDLIPPWQIYRDPNAKPHKPQSGNYWIHEEWVDWWVLRELEKRGIFKNIEAIKSKSDSSDSTKQNIQKARRGQEHKRNKYITSHNVLDYYGVVLDPKGELLLPNGRYTIAGEKVIRDIDKVPFDHVRWPGVSFSPVPHPLRFEGRGILEGVVDLWSLINNLVNLHVDNLNWDINQMFEVDTSLLADPTDTEVYPGKAWVKKPSATGEAVRAIALRTRSPEVLMNIQNFEKWWSNGSFVNEFIEGLPGYRSEITKGEVEMKTQASLGVFNSMGKELERGAKDALWLANDVIMHNLKSNPDHPIFDGAGLDNEAAKIVTDPLSDLRKYAYISVSGISDIIKRSELVQKIEAAMQKAVHPLYARYHKPYELLKQYYEVLGMDNQGIIVTKEEAEQVTKDSAEELARLQAEAQVRPALEKKTVGGNKGEVRKQQETLKG